MSLARLPIPPCRHPEKARRNLGGSSGQCKRGFGIGWLLSTLGDGSGDQDEKEVENEREKEGFGGGDEEEDYEQDED